MAQKRTKRHHIVPRALRKNFCFDGDKTWYSEKRDDKFSIPEERNTKSTFARRDYYTVLENGTPSDKVERLYYGEIDNYLGRLVPQLLVKLERSEAPVFSSQAVDSLNSVIYQMVKRTPDFVSRDKKMDEIEIGKQIVSGDIERLRKNSPDDPNLRPLYQELEDDNKLKQLGRHVRVSAQAKTSNKVQKLLRQFSVRWGFCDGSHSLILSSSMVYLIGNGGHNGIANPKTEIWFPISPKYALVLMRDQSQKFPLLNAIDRDFARDVNLYAARSSFAVASHSEKLLRSITNHR